MAHTTQTSKAGEQYRVSGPVALDLKPRMPHRVRGAMPANVRHGTCMFLFCDDAKAPEPYLDLLVHPLVFHPTPLDPRYLQDPPS
jgi:hypothetical protein